LIGGVPKFDQSVTRNTKIILKRLALKYFPPDFVNRSKLGFALPLKGFLHHPQFRPIMEDLVLPGVRRRGILNAKVVERYWRENLNGHDELTESIWICAAFEIWGRLFLDGNANSVLN
jgi:asparagine synthase (glutamine-hydrolysing)